MEETWKSVLGYEGIYSASNLGRIMGRNRNILKPFFVSGYLRVCLIKNGKRSSRTVHSLVIEAFKGIRPPGKVARHIDGNVENNSDSNLVWSTQKENIADKKSHGTYLFGEKHPTSVLTEGDVVEIRRMAELGISRSEIASAFLVTASNIYSIVNRKTWNHIHKQT